MAVKNAQDLLQEVASHCVAVRTRVINRVVTGMYNDAMRPFGVRVEQMNIIIVVARRGEVSPSQVAEFLHLEKSTLSRNVERLQEKGWLEVVAQEDGRTHHLKVTKEGLALFRKLLPGWRKVQVQVTELLGKEGIASICHMAGQLGFPKK